MSTTEGIISHRPSRRLTRAADPLGPGQRAVASYVNPFTVVRRPV